MIKSKFTFFQVQAKSVFTDTSKLAEPGFCDGPKVLNAVNMVMSICKFITSMLNPIVFFIAEIYKAVIGLKSIGINGRVLIDLLLYNRHQSALRAVSDNLGINLATSFDQTKNYVLALCSTASGSSYSPCSKVAFVNLNFASIKRALLLTIVCYSLPYPMDDIVNSFSGNTSKFRNFYGLNIQGEQLNYLPDFGLRNS